jgi:hypothetical protein
MTIVSVDTYKMQFGFTLFCKIEFFTIISQFCEKFIFTIYCSCRSGFYFQWFFSGIMFTLILYVSTNFFASYSDTCTVVVIIPPFPPFFGKKVSVKCVILPDLKRRIVFVFHFQPIALIDPERVSPSSSFRVGCIKWIPTPRKRKSIRGLGSDLSLRRHTWAFNGHLACLRSTQDPKSTVFCIFIYCRQLEFLRSQSYGFKGETFSRNSEQVEFSLTTHKIFRDPERFLASLNVGLIQNVLDFQHILKFDVHQSFVHMLALLRIWFGSFVSWIRGRIRHICVRYIRLIHVISPFMPPGSWTVFFFGH